MPPIREIPNLFTTSLVRFSVPSASRVWQPLPDRVAVVLFIDDIELAFTAYIVPVHDVLFLREMSR